ncbi:MAG: type II secretion system minor pseudopilin GspH [Shewanella psychromarinicola]|uniref:Type II secretion system protein H n=1 Tax=Shewanella psychromarinicola TaxID=2487742 RepID=A0A3N4EF04_9GAMM|nr:MULTISPECIES: type II secretion system minor pseudopilin GspH [Shewanella]AZG34451.1 type II secretion system protein GspH [Shewanella psychromarinicola]MCL1081994.1 type II secretion system minor pseudopilin GspH [Shewanella psychromarinicola]PKG79452.1 type II secretion system protein GspH [Shewanella sp. Actino-trap-3]RPA32551.1 type II secretion system protein GspH [Shewanella psychromarinicola]
MIQHRQAGFTLLEVLIVALLMGLVASAVTLSMNVAGPEQMLKKPARRFIAATEMVLDESVLSGQFIGIVIDEDQYEFVFYQEGKWMPVEQDRLLSAEKMDAGITLDIVIDGMPLVQEDEQNESWFDEPFIDEKSEEEKKKHPEPQILLFPSGEMTPFELGFNMINDDSQPVNVLVVGDALGRLTLGRVDE